MFHISISLLGFLVFIIMFNQILSGVALSFSLMTDSLLTFNSREEEDMENLYTDDFFWLHERGVDFVVITIYLHFFRKLFIGVFDLEQEHSWKSGVIAFLVLQVTIFAGLVLCTTHLSEITLLIAVNAMHTVFLFFGKPYWWIFTNKTLNTDTMVRLTYFHYVIAFYLFFLGLIHGIDMHYDWKPNINFSGIKQQLNWWDEALLNEFYLLINFLLLVFFFSLFLYTEPEALNYEIFMWGDIGIVNDVRFLSVAPHWYFRPFMAWLIACPYHYVGIFGLFFFFLIIFFQVSLFNHSELSNLKYQNSIIFFIYNIYNIFKNIINQLFLNKTNNFNNFEIYNINSWNQNNTNCSIQWLFSYSIFIICILYTLSFLPYGRFYSKIGGNVFLFFSYFYIFAFFTFSFFRNSFILNNSKNILINI